MGAMEFITRLRDWASRREAEEHSDPEIKPVEQDVEKYTEAEDECPDRHDVENQGIHDRGVPEAVGGVRTRRSGLPPSIGLLVSCEIDRSSADKSSHNQKPRRENDEIRQETTKAAVK